VSWSSLYFGGGLNLAALILGALAAGAALIWPRGTVSITAQTLAALIVFAPLVLPNVTNLAAQVLSSVADWKPEGAEPTAAPPLGFLEPPFGWFQRGYGWAHTAELIRERLITGWGFGGSAQFSETVKIEGYETQLIPRHPQNTPLQIWLETGAVGALLAAGALASFGRRAGAALAEDRVAAAAAVGLLVSAAVIVNVSGGAWSLWWWGAVALGAALIRVAKRPS
jgi:O-antigen ligase